MTTAQAVLLAEAEVVLAEGDRGVDEAGAVVGGDEVPEQDGVAALAVLLRADEREGREVADALELAPGEAVEQLRVLAEHALHQRFGHDVDLARPCARARRGSSGSTATAALETSVHGVVVHTSSTSPGSSGGPASTVGKRT